MPKPDITEFFPPGSRCAHFATSSSKRAGFWRNGGLLQWAPICRRQKRIAATPWADFDFEALTVLVQRTRLHGRVGDVKTEHSRDSVPLDPAPVQSLRQHQERSYSAPEGWLFANPISAGTRFGRSGRRVLEKAFQNSVKAIEARNAAGSKRVA